MTSRFYNNERIAAPLDDVSAHCLHVYHSPGSSNTDFHDNTCEGFAIGAGLYSGSSNVKVRRNTFIGQTRLPWSHAKGKTAGLSCGGSTGMQFLENTVQGAPDNGRMISLKNNNCTLTSDKNHFSGGGEVFVSADGKVNTPSAWKALGYDKNSTF